MWQIRKKSNAVLELQRKYHGKGQEERTKSNFVASGYGTPNKSELSRIPSVETQSTIVSELSCDSMVCDIPRIALNECSTKSKACSVHFSEVNIRYYPTILGDNPACSTGPPLSIGWDHVKERSYRVDQFEKKRESKSYRLRHELVISRMDRKRLLKGQGYTDNEIYKTLNAVHVDQQHRRSSAKDNVSLVELAESTKARLAKIFTKKKKYTTGSSVSVC